MRYLTLLLLMLCLSSCYAVRAYKFRKLNLMDHEKMPYVTVDKSDHPYSYAEATIDNYPHLTQWLDSNLANTYTAAFLVLKNDTIIYERYFDDYTVHTLLPSYSVIKSYVSTLVAIAHQEGKIQSLDEAITQYIPELLKNDIRFQHIRIRDLLNMRSGIQWNEGSYSLKDDAIKMGFRPNIMKQLKKLKIATAPTDKFEYKSINTLLLGLVVERATQMEFEKYFQEKLWKPLGAASAATLNTDKKGHPVSFAGLNATARDFSLLGSMFLHDGYWNGQQILTQEWVNSSTRGDSLDAYGGYKNQWWAVREIKSFKDSMDAVNFVNMDSENRTGYSRINSRGQLQYRVKLNSESFMANGILGQYIYVQPENNLVIVRLGHYWKHPKFYVENLMREVSKML